MDVFRKNIAGILALFPDEQATGMLYSGGGADGFTGIVADRYGKEKVKQMVDTIIACKTNGYGI
ncbi:MAG: hypothetical protein LUD02_02740 [Tannerellaceae bacterium]|nr:hypothetical protein [Tannerellaceae bacterium]MCD8263190.1 hypothetical protein [Tannerellaceae bacterium]